jgi:tetratricopeptide (TPR) repeat protein
MTYSIKPKQQFFWKQYRSFRLAGLNCLSVGVCILLCIQSGFAQNSRVDSLNKVLLVSPDDSNKVNAIYDLATALSEQEPDRSISLAKKGIVLAEKIGFKQGASICLNVLGLSYYNLSKFDSAQLCWNKRYQLVSGTNDKRGIASTCDNLSIICIHYGRIKDALDLRKRTLAIYDSLKDATSLANGYTWIGNIYKEQAEYSLALEYYLKAERIYEVENDVTNIGYPLLNISSVYRYMKIYDKAKDFALQAWNKFGEINYTKGVGVSLYRLAIIYSEEKDFDNAIKTLLRAKETFEEIKDAYFLTLTNMLLGTCYHDSGNSDLASVFYNDALVTARSIGDIILKSSILQNIATIHYDKHDFQKALTYLIEADSGFYITRDRNALMEISINFNEVYCQLNIPDSAIKYLVRFRQLSDSIFSDEQSKSLAEIQTKYESEKKDKEITELNLQNETRKNRILSLNYLNEITSLKLQNSKIENDKKSQSLKLALAEQERQRTNIELLKINELDQLRKLQSEKEREKLIRFYFLISSIVLSIIFILIIFVFSLKKKKQQAILQQKAAELSHQVSENNMKALRSQMNPHFIFNCIQTIERLVNESKLYETRLSLERFSNLTRTVLENSIKKEILLSDELETSRQYIELEKLRFRNSFTYTITIGPGIDENTTLVPPLILQPFIENSIKHGFRNSEKQGHLKIELKIENDTLICTVEDNGIGRRMNLNIKPISGFKKESMGIKIAEERLQLISKTKNILTYFLIEDLHDTYNNPAGTRVKLFLPYVLTI